MNKKTGLISNLFDLSFSELITTRIIQFLYGVAILASAGGATGALLLTWERGLLGNGQDSGNFVLSIALSVPLAFVVFLLCLIISRVALELVLVVFRIAENTDFLAEHQNVD